MKRMTQYLTAALRDGGGLNLKVSLPKHEGFLLAGAVLLFLAFPWLSRRIDITSAPVDPGKLSVVIMAVLAFLIFKSLTWLLIRTIWPVFAEYSEDRFAEDFGSLPVRQKVLVYLGFYVLLLLGLIATLAALM